MSTVISILHHSIPNIGRDQIAEEGNVGWHFRSAKAIRRYSKLDSECLRPGGDNRWITRTVKGIKVTLAPTARPPLSDRFWKWNEIAPAMAGYVKARLRGAGMMPYIHEYRTLNSGLLVGELRDTPMILQHHGSMPPELSLGRSLSGKGLAHSIRCLPDILREGSVRKIRGAVFVLNRVEKEHLERLGVEASVRLRTMGVDFDEITPLCHEEKAMLRKRLGLPEDSTILTSYVGVFREGFSTMKGAHDIVRIYEELKSALRNNIQLVISGICKRIADEWREKGIAAYEFLPHKTFVDIVRSSDLYFLPASSTYRYGGVGVAIMEALAAGVPVVSPTLVHFPAAEKVKCVGLKTPWVDDEKDLRVFIEKLICAVQNHSQFRRDIIRSISYSYYSWKSFVEELECVTKKWL